MKNSFISIFHESPIKIAARFFLYLLMLFGFTLSLPNFFIRYGMEFFLENHTVEWLQFFILMMTGIMFIIGACWLKRFRQLFLLLALLTAFTMARELDSLLDKIIPLIGWKAGFIFIFYFFWVLYKDKAVLSYQLTSFFGTRSFAFLFCGVLVALPFAQLVGNGHFLETLMGSLYNNDYKRVIEELGELFGYMFFFMGSLEALVQMEGLPKGRS